MRSCAAGDSMCIMTRSPFLLRLAPEPGRNVTFSSSCAAFAYKKHAKEKHDKNEQSSQSCALHVGDPVHTNVIIVESGCVVVALCGRYFFVCLFLFVLHVAPALLLRVHTHSFGDWGTRSVFVRSSPCSSIPCFVRDVVHHSSRR
jgi:hypothetical protein